MTVLEIIKVVGFATGSALHFYFAWLIWRRSRRDFSSSRIRREVFPTQAMGSLFAARAQSAARVQIAGSAAGRAESGDGAQSAANVSERAFIAVGLCLGFWFLGNLLITVQENLLDFGRAPGLFRIWSSIAVIGIALFPSVLLHSHIAFWSWMDNYRTMSRRRAILISALFYVPMICLPYTVYRINTGDLKPYLLKLQWFLLPYSIWFVLALWSAAVLDWFMKDRLYEWAVRERAFLKLLAVLLFINGAVEPLVIGAGAGPNDYLWIAFILLSLAPTFTVAYYIYRYNLYELVIKSSIVYATLAVLFLIVYNYGIRHLDALLVSRGQVRPGIVEGLLVLAMVALAGPLARWIDGAVRSLFVREIGMYRDVVRQVSAGGQRAAVSGQGAVVSGQWSRVGGQRAGGSGEGEDRGNVRALAAHDHGSGESRSREGRASELESLIVYAEDTIRRGLELGGVRIIPFYPEQPAGAAERVVSKITRNGAGLIEADEDVIALGGTAAYALKREDRLLGLMIIAADPNTLVSDKRAVLEVLSGQVAIGIESAILIEEKLRLERELARRERLAALGQMAATVAHEVKNPLSSIKSIAQVMREDGSLAGYARDLDLIIGEINRLSSTVSQLLAFSRSGSQPIAAGGPVNLREVIDSALAVLKADADNRGVRLDVSNALDCLLTSQQSEALRESLINLVLNAIQASPDRGRVSIITEIDESDALLFGTVGDDGKRAAARSIKLSVSDEGPGVSAEDQTRIFEPFYTTKPRGTGLGLAIVQRRINDINGTLEIMSPIYHGRGTTFTVQMSLESS
jgi:signal transduction histidine kinase